MTDSVSDRPSGHHWTCVCTKCVPSGAEPLVRVVTPDEVAEIRARDGKADGTWFKVPALGACGRAFIDRRLLLQRLDQLVCPHGYLRADNVCGPCSRGEPTPLAVLSDARLTWAMACVCDCPACNGLDAVIRQVLHL